MLDLISILSIFAIGIYVVLKIFQMQDSPNPNLFQDQEPKEENDQGNS
jgi:uncharacterized protein YneF (UPF0154 family)